MRDAEGAQVRVRLARADEQDRLAGHVRHRERCSDLYRSMELANGARMRREQGGRTLSSIVSNLASGSGDQHSGL
mgnify:CR=1 FL=1